MSSGEANALRAPGTVNAADTLRVHGLRTTCCIVGGGPAGMLLGLMLARAGIEIVVLEKHADFLRDFRGDTIHPSTLEVLWEMGMLEALLERPHQELQELDGDIFGRRIKLADFSHLPTHARFIALMPQWDFLDFVATQAERMPTFRLFMGSEVTDLLYDGQQIEGVVAATKEGIRHVRAQLTIAADGRGSIVRERAAASVIDHGAPIDVLWFRLSRRPGDERQALGHVAPGRVLVLLERGDYWQCAFVIPKGSFGDWQARGMDELKGRLAQLLPLPRERFAELVSWDGVCVYVNVGRRAVRIRFESLDAPGTVEGSDDDEASTALALVVATAAFGKCKQQLGPLFQRVAIELEERRGARGVQFLPTKCAGCLHVDLLAAEHCSGGQGVCAACGGRAWVVPGGTYTEGDVALFRELSEIVARGNVRAVEAQRLGLDIERACSVGAATEGFINVARRLPPLEPMRLVLESSPHRQRQTLMMLATVLNATALGRRSGTMRVVDAPALSPAMATNPPRRR